MQGLIDSKTADIDAEVARLEEDFIVIFWKTIKEINGNVSYYERQGLVWWALYNKQEFMTGIRDLRNMLVDGLNATRTQLMTELAAERDGFAHEVVDNRTAFRADTNAMSARLDQAK